MGASSTKTQIQERAREVNRLHKALEDVRIKLDTVAADVMGKPGATCSTRWWPRDQRGGSRRSGAPTDAQEDPRAARSAGRTYELLSRRRGGEARLGPRSGCSSLHRDQMIQTAAAQRYPVEFAFDCAAGERHVGRIRVDPGNPLLDVEIPEAGLETEAGTRSKVFWTCRIEGRFLRPHVSHAHVTRLERPQQSRETLQVRGFGIRHDVEVLRWSNHAMSVDREASDDDVAHARFVQSPQQGLRVERTSVMPSARA